MPTPTQPAGQRGTPGIQGLRHPRRSALSRSLDLQATRPTHESFDGCDVPVYNRPSWDAGTFGVPNYVPNQGLSPRTIAEWNAAAVPDSPARASRVLKALIRRGVPDSLRRVVWAAVTGARGSLDSAPRLYDRDIRSTFGHRGPPKFIASPPLFGGVFAPSSHFVSSNAVDAAKRILCTIASTVSSVGYCPRIPDLLLALLGFMPEKEAYVTMLEVLKRSESDRRWNMDSRGLSVACCTFDALLARQMPALHKKGKEVGVKWFELAHQWFARMFVDTLPYSIVLRVVDCYLNEGTKIFYRVGLALLRNARQALLAPRGVSRLEFLATLTRVAAQQDPCSLLRTAFRFRLSRSSLWRIGSSSDMAFRVPQPAIEVYYRPKLATPSEIFSDVEMEVLWSFLPRRFAVLDPRTLYKASRDGYSLTRLVDKARDYAPLLMVLKLADASVLGCYVSVPLDRSQTPAGFFGDGECFVFTLKPRAQQYRATTRDHFFVLLQNSRSEIESLSLGAGALELCANLAVTSEPSPTFGSPSLTGDPGARYEELRRASAGNESFDGSDVSLYSRSSWDTGSLSVPDYACSQGLSPRVIGEWNSVTIPESPQRAAAALKGLIRRGVPGHLRRVVWGALTGATAVLETNPQVYVRDARITFGSHGPPAFISSPPLFGGVFAPSSHKTCPDAVDAAKRILCTIASTASSVSYCPRTPDLVLALLGFMPEKEAYVAVLEVLKRSESDGLWNMDRRGLSVACCTFDALLARQMPALHKWGMELGVKWVELAHQWFTRMFVDTLPYHMVLRVVDCYLSEGTKIFYRVGLALLQHARQALMELKEGVPHSEIFATLNRVTAQQDPCSLIKTAFRFSLSRSALWRIGYSANTNVALPEPTIEVYYRPKLQEPSGIFTDVEMEVLWSFLPQRFAVLDPRLLYRASRDGYTLDRLVERAQGTAPLLLVLKLADDSVMGCYLSVSLARHHAYTGDGECCVFTLRPRAQQYGATLANNYFVLSHTDSLSIGAGALELSADLVVSSRPSDTFGNPGLVGGSEGSSGCVAAELYTVE
eukprot:m51a1_g11352 hypothetical protein (1051) ;mRNA; r:15935-22059